MIQSSSVPDTLVPPDELPLSLTPPAGGATQKIPPVSAIMGPAVATGPFPSYPVPAVAVQFPAPGTVLRGTRGDYAVQAVIGSGEFGAVYEAVGPFDQIYAVKMMRPANRPYVEVQAEWAREVQRLLSLRHPNVVYIFDAFEVDYLFYLALERCDHALSAMLGIPMQEGLVIELARQLLAAVQFLHDNDVVHDDLHPGNILISHGNDRPIVKISDFGISTELRGMPAIRPNVVHHAIMAPEIIETGYTGKQSDIYQTGLLLFWMLTGESAVPLGASYDQIVRCVAEGVPRKRAETIGTPLGALVAKMLRRRGQFRDGSAREVWGRLCAVSCRGWTVARALSRLLKTPSQPGRPTIRRERAARRASALDSEARSMTGAEGIARALELRRALGAFLEQTRAPVIVVEPNGRLASANDAALAQYGYGLEDIVRMRIEDLMALPRPELEDDLQRALQRWPGVRRLQRRAHRRRDGSVLWVVPVAGPVIVQGETLIVSVLQDVSAVVSAEENAHIDQVAASSFQVWEHGGRALRRRLRALRRGPRAPCAWNRTLLAWRDLEESQVVGRRCDEIFPRACARQPCAHALALAERRRIVYEVESTRGQPLRVEVAPAPLNDTGVAVVHVAYDLTDQRETRSRLVAADRLASLGRVAAGVAHEVNNPAAFLLLALPLAKDRIAQGRAAEATTLLDEAITATTQITEVMRDLGGVARDRPRAVVDLAGLANGAIRIASYEAQTRARVERALEDGVTAEVRSARVAQVLLNLILNAAQAIPDGDPTRHRIDVAVRRAGDRALIEVADTGPGVSEAIGDRIFEPFFTTRASRGGTGLGLWLSRTIVEDEGGLLTWRNRPEGGAIFTVSLPLARGRESDKLRSPQPRPL